MNFYDVMMSYGLAGQAAMVLPAHGIHPEMWLLVDGSLMVH